MTTTDNFFLPLLADRDPDAPLAWRGGVPVSTRQFLATWPASRPNCPAKARPSTCAPTATPLP
ncbi:hypothetical protein [Variovorax sp. E3]|uniref:hypothetical protein n=1 Tax=Variovorax sp. E3 TaxID=1914993 RepID=UPI0022B66FB0|nr:hypothetical protein [Variovorax sp. E3]